MKLLSALSALVLLVLPMQLTASDDPEEVELAELMGQMQLYLHKLQLSSLAANSELASFYLHELEELSGVVVETVSTYDGHEVGKLTASILVPRIQSAEDQIEDQEGLLQAVKGVTEACNNCHQATAHGFIKITFSRNNPFNQEF